MSLTHALFIHIYDRFNEEEEKRRTVQELQEAPWDGQHDGAPPCQGLLHL